MFGKESIKEIFAPSFQNVGDKLVGNTRGDRVIWGTVLILTLASLLLVYSSTGSLAYRMSRSTESYLFKQFAFIIIGMVVSDQIADTINHINRPTRQKLARFIRAKLLLQARSRVTV